MFNNSIIMFITGWVLWFIIDKHPASLGILLPGESESLLDNFQLAFNLLKAGLLSASFVFIWKAHYLILSIISGVLISILSDSASNIFRRRRLHQIMHPEKKNLVKPENKSSNKSE